MAEFAIGALNIGGQNPPVVVAEIGANHDGNIDKAERMFVELARTGAKLVKLQMYSAEELVADADRMVKWGRPGQQTEERVGNMFSRISLPREAFAGLFAQARSLGLEPFATPFSEEGVDFLMTMDTSCFKIAASDVTHLPLLRHIARTGKPVVLSLGKCTLSEADEAVNCLMDNGCKDIAVLHCVASYPSPIDDMNLRVIPTLAQVYPECIIGFSDHSLGTTASLASVALGAKIIEKHVTLDHNDPGPDHWFSLDMDQLEKLVQGVHDVYRALGHPRKRILECELQGRFSATRSLVTNRDMFVGERIGSKDLKVVRPGTGIPPRHFDTIVGMMLHRNVSNNTPLQWEMFK